MAQDPLIGALKAFLKSQLADPSRLHFAVLPQPVRSSQVTADDGQFDQTQADEMFSRDVADRIALIDNDVRQDRQGSFAELLRWGVIEAACFYELPDKSEAAISRDRTAFDSVLAQARRRMEEAVILSPLPATYVPSRAIPEDWCDPLNNDGWSKYSETLTSDNKTNPDGSAEPQLPPVPMLPLIIRRFNPDIVKNIPWPKPKPYDPGNIDPIPDYFAQGMPQGPHSRWSDWATLRTPASFNTFTSVNNASHVASFDVLSFPLGGGPPPRWQELPELFPSAPADPLVKIEDLKNASASLPNLEQAAAFGAHVVREGIEMSAVGRDKVEVSLEYMIVRIERPWVFMPLFVNTNWYVPNMHRGQVASGLVAGEKVRDVAAEAAIVVRNVNIRASFSNADADLLGKAFAIGPFAIDQNAEIVAGELRMPGMQIVAYVDADLPTIPPRSDPNLLV